MPELALGVLLVWMPPACRAASAARPAAPGSEAGCRDGWRRVGTMKDPTLGRSWAVVANCEHPAWPARLEPAARWKPLPEWVPAGSQIVVVSPEGGSAIRLNAVTVAPGRVGESVGARLTNHALVRVRLTAPGAGNLEVRARWGTR